MQPLRFMTILPCICEVDEDLYNEEDQYKEARKLQERGKITPEILQSSLYITLERAKEIIKVLKEEDDLLNLKEYNQDK